MDMETKRKPDWMAITLIASCSFVALGLGGIAGWYFGRGGESQAVRSAGAGIESRDSSLSLICETSQSIPVDGIALATTPMRSAATAGIDFAGHAGWYQGQIAISESRKGTLSVDGERLVVSRPAMFQKFGEMITREEFSIDRKTGAFIQSITLQSGRTVSLIRGYCGLFAKAPF